MSAPATLVGELLSHYRITARIGAGGMGEVYRATDTSLGRDVALKVLPADMASRPDRVDRFRREARALAALDHPGIVTVYSVEEAAGIHFLTMQLVEGQPLDRLIPERGLPIERILAIGSSLTDALAAAHGKGIVHRDLKPANVMLAPDGSVKVLDFGLAKVGGPDNADSSLLSTEARTREGVVMGTVPYMSPEQLQGRTVDPRTDLFSLGVMLYEMATGRRPFQADSAAGLMTAILRDTPSPVTSVRADVPHALQRVIERCLEKDAAARFQAALEVKAALAGAPAGATAPASADAKRRAESAPHSDEAPWIAVLPLKTHGADADLESFADGLGEDITAGLSRFSHLHVLSRQSAFSHVGALLDARELGARYALAGAVRKAGGALRVSVQLLDCPTGTNLWAESYDRDLAGAAIFAVQDDITDRVVATVADPYGVLVRSMAAAIRDRPVAELTASQLVLRFFAYWHQVRPDEHAALRTALECRLEREPSHADARACLARLYSHEFSHHLNPLPGSLERALGAARRAVEVDPTCQMAWESLADVSFMAGDSAAFRTAAERALSLNPRNTNTAAAMAVLFSMSGDVGRGVELARRAMALNAHHPGWYYAPLALDHFVREEYEEALGAAKRMQMPDFFWSHLMAVAAAGRLGRQDEVRIALDELRRLFPEYRKELQSYKGTFIRSPAVWDQLVKGLDAAEALAEPRVTHSGRRRGR